MLVHIVGQQLSVAASFTIYDRLVRAVGGGVPTPNAVALLGVDGLRACGLSAPKAEYALALAEAEGAGGLDIEHLDEVPDEEVVARLTAVRGVGLSSAHTFLVRNLGRPDVLPEANNGIRRAIQRLWETPNPPTPAEVRERGEGWAPYRSYAAALLWRSLSTTPQPRAAREEQLSAP
jgi:DNA-3-methyladenine glycosylase II